MEPVLRDIRMDEWKETQLPQKKMILQTEFCLEEHILYTFG